MTRKTRGASKKMAELNLISITEDLINKEVTDFAINLYGVLNVISTNYSRDAVVDLIPEIIVILNKLDASLKVNSDLKENLCEVYKENEYLKRCLNAEKNIAKANLEASLSMEMDADNQISTLKDKIKLLESSQMDLLNDLKTRDTTINLLSADCAELSLQLDMIKTDPSFLKKNGDDKFKFPKNTSRPTKLEVQVPCKTSNRYESLTLNDTICDIPTFKKVTAMVHREQTDSPLHPTLSQASKLTSTNEKKNLLF